LVEGLTSATESAAPPKWHRAGRIAGKALSWLIALGKWLAFAVVVAIGIGLAAYVPVKVTSWAISTESVFAEAGAAVVCILVSVGVLLRLWRKDRLRESPRIGALVVIVFALAVAIGSFSALTAVLYHEGAVSVSGTAVREDNVIDEATVFYAWHVVNTVPLLDIPKNLRWEKPFEFEDRLGGVLLMAFAGAVLLPLIPAIRLATARRPSDPYEDAVVKALRRNARGWKVRAPRDRRSQQVAAVESGGTRILVDAVSELQTVDAALRRLQRLLLVEAGGPRRSQDLSVAIDEAREGGAYLLVAGAVDDATRELVERSLRENDIRGRLAVWRSGEPGEELATLVERFLDELKRPSERAGES
jgi:hypothetical protein